MLGVGHKLMSETDSCLSFPDGGVRKPASAEWELLGLVFQAPAIQPQPGFFFF